MYVCNYGQETRQIPFVSELVEHRAQSPVREVKMLVVWPSIEEGFPTPCPRVTIYIYNEKLSYTCEKFVAFDFMFCRGQQVHRFYYNCHVFTLFKERRYFTLP